MNTERVITEEKVEEVRKTYDDEDEGLAEDFLDKVFGVESLMKQKEWEKAVLANYSWIFDSDDIRK